MANKMKRKIGNSTSVKIGKKTYSSYDTPNLKPQSKKVNTIKGNENAPRNITQKSIDNQANKLKTDVSKSSGVGVKNTPTPQATTKPLNTAKTQVSTRSVTKVAEQKQQYKSNIQRQTAIRVQPQTIISGKKPISGQLKNPTSTKNGVINSSIVKVENKGNKTKTDVSKSNGVGVKTTLIPHTTTKPLNTAKTQISTRSVTKVAEQQQQYRSNMQRQTAIRVQPQTIISSKQPIVGHFKRPTSSKNGFITNAIVKTENAMRSQNDSGTSTISVGLTSVGVGVKTFKTAQIAGQIGETYALPYVKKVARGAYNIAGTSVKVVRSIDSTVGLIKTGNIQLNYKTAMQFKSFTVNKVMGTKPVQNLVHAVTGVRTSILKGKTYSVMAGQGIIRTVNVARGVVNGTVKVKIPIQALKNAKIATFKSIRTTGRFVGYKLRTGAVSLGGNLKTGIKTGIIRGGKLGIKGISNGVVGIGNMMMNTDDIGTQAFGLAIKSSQYSIKGIISTPKAIRKGVNGVKTAVKGTVKTAQTMYKIGKGVAGFARMASKFGLKNTIMWHRNQAMKAIAKAGGSAVQALMTLLKAAGRKVIVPLLIIIICTVAVMNMLSAPVASMGAMFGGSFTNKSSGTDVEVHEYLTKAIEIKQEEFDKKIERLENDPSYDYTKVIRVGTVYTKAQLVSLIEPLFRTIIFYQFNLEPTQADLDKTLDDIWNTLIKVKTKSVSRSSGSGENEHTEHGLEITITYDGYDALLAKYFTDEIDRLANLSNRTPEQDDRLEDLKDNYDLCLAYKEEFDAQYGTTGGTGGTGGTGSGATDLSGVTLINGTRPANNTITALAEQQVGNQGGQPYWSWYGFDGRVAWCACFVSWCEEQTGGIASGAVPKFSYCPEGIQWFKDKGQWASGGYTDVVAGDIIFFDWDNDGISDHVGLVRGTDGENVYTIEGNSGDSVRSKSYSISSSCIIGYGLPNYK